MTSPSPAPDFPVPPWLPSPGGSWFSCLLGEVLDTSVCTQRPTCLGSWPSALPPPSTHSPVNVELSDSRLKLAGTGSRDLIPRVFFFLYKLPSSQLSPIPPPPAKGSRDGIMEPCGLGKDRLVENAPKVTSFASLHTGGSGKQVSLERC